MELFGGLTPPRSPEWNPAEGRGTVVPVTAAGGRSETLQAALGGSGVLHSP